MYRYRNANRLPCTVSVVIETTVVQADEVVVTVVGSFLHTTNSCLYYPFVTSIKIDGATLWGTGHSIGHRDSVQPMEGGVGG